MYLYIGGDMSQKSTDRPEIDQDEPPTAPGRQILAVVDTDETPTTTARRSQPEDGSTAHDITHTDSSPPDDESQSRSRRAADEPTDFASNSAMAVSSDSPSVLVRVDVPGPDENHIDRLLLFRDVSDHQPSWNRYEELTEDVAATGAHQTDNTHRSTADRQSDRAASPVGLVCRTAECADGTVFVCAHEEPERAERELAAGTEPDRLDHVASILSHDLRNPLSVAQGYLQLAQKTGEEAALERVESSLDRMETIVEDVLTLTRKGMTVDDTQQVHLESTAIEAWRHVVTDHASLVVEDDASFEADPTRLLQLFENLFRNANEHVGDDVTVTVGADDDGFYVEDDGPGIPDNRRKNVREWGFTTNDDGTGYGLSIVTRIADAHGWDLSITDGQTGGARFEFRGLDLSLPAE